MIVVKGEYNIMISYKPLWETMKKHNYSTYTLRKMTRIGGGTIEKLKANDNITTDTLNELCKLFRCDLSKVAEYIEDEEES